MMRRGRSGRCPIRPAAGIQAIQVGEIGPGRRGAPATAQPGRLSGTVARAHGVTAVPGHRPGVPGPEAGAGGNASGRRRRRLGLVPPALLVLVALSLPAQAADPWYVDLKGHWVEDEVRVLWEEGVTDGYPRADALGRPQWYFLPNAFMERAQFAVLLVKVMGLPPDPTGPPAFTDVPPDYRAGGDVAAYPWIQAGARAGLFADERGRFRPADVIRRDEAVAMLIHALELDWYARSLPEERVAALLGRYADAARIRPELRRAMAAAVDLAIVVGYGDGYLRPDRSLTRAEGATLIYKSALIRVGAKPPSFSPDGDGQEETTELLAQALLNRNQSSWQVDVLDAQGNPVNRWSGTRLPARWTWDGTDDQGRPLPAGLYLLRGQLVTRQGSRFVSAIEPVILVYHRLLAAVSPVVVEPGERVTVTAQTEGPAERVTLQPPVGGPRPLQAEGSGSWRTTWNVPDGLPPGTYTLVVAADFPTVRREQTLAIQVLPALWIEGEALPNPAAAGSTVTVRASTSSRIDRVQLVPPQGKAIPLHPVGPGRWEVRWSVPAGAAPGSVLELGLEGWQGSRRVAARIRLAIAAGEIQPVFYLSR